MSKNFSLLVVLLAVLFTARFVSASEVWVVQFNTPFPDVVPPCQTLVSWHSHLMLHNTTTGVLEVRLLGVSNGDMQPDATSLVISPGTTASVRRASPPQLRWNPSTDVALWVNKLDVPSGVVVANRAEAEIAELMGGPDPPCVARNQFSAGLPLRVFTALVPAFIPQYHLGTDVGDYISGNQHLDSRINVGVYNDANRTATVTVEVRCSPGPVVDVFNEPDPLIREVTLQIPSRSVSQTQVLVSTQGSPCPISVGAAPYHVVVKSDQPGFSYVTSVLNGSLPTFPAATSISN